MQAKCSGWRSRKRSRSTRGALDRLGVMVALIRRCGEADAASARFGATGHRNQKSVARNRVRSAYLSGGSIDHPAHEQPSHNNPWGPAIHGTSRAACALLAIRTPTSAYLRMRAGALQSSGSARARCEYRCREAVVSVEVPDALLDALADGLASRLADRLAALASPEGSPWMTFEEAVEYTKVPAGTFRKLSAEGVFTAHGGKRRVYHRRELDAALSASLCRPRISSPTILRRAS